MAVFLRIAIAVLAAAVLADSHAIQLAELVTPRLSPRITFYGGFSLSASTCPSGTSNCGGSSLHGCCPTGQNCFTFAFSAFCCPDNQTCQSQIEALPICADSSWTLFKSNNGEYFCCAAGQIGVSASGAGVCADSDVSVPFSELASTMTQIGGATGTASPTATSAGGSKAKTTAGATGSASTSTNTSSLGGSTSSSSSSTKLSTGVIIGIAVGAAIAIALVAFTSWFCYRRGQRRAMQMQQPVTIAPPVYNVITPSQPPEEYKGPVASQMMPKPEQRYVQDRYTPEIDSQMGSGVRAELGM